jgi:hypothetical protein
MNVSDWSFYIMIAWILHDLSILHEDDVDDINFYLEAAGYMAQH